MIRNDIIESIRKALQNLGISAGVISLEHPSDLNNGDYSTNVAMAYAKQSGTNPRVLAEQIKTELEKELPKEIEKVEVAGAGFINFYLSREFFADSIKEILQQGGDWGKSKKYNNKKILVEHSSPNLFKPFHIGHVMNNTIGESISRLAKFSGAHVEVTSFPSDISLGIGKAVWILLKDNGTNGVQRLRKIGPSTEVLEYLGDCYVRGTVAYDESEQNALEIRKITKQLYEKDNHSEAFKVYEEAKERNLAYFKAITSLLGTDFQESSFIYESEAGEEGVKIIKDNTPSVFTQSQGAYIYEGEQDGLHTRVFINKEGYPTYEAKDIGLIYLKFKRYNPDLSIFITDHEQIDHFRVVLAAASKINHDWKNWVDKSIHRTHGRMTFKGQKMSSRLGGVPIAQTLLDSLREEVSLKAPDLEKGAKHSPVDNIAIASLKFSILRAMAGKNINFDPETSLSFEGDSGPYLQYSAVRSNSILEKSGFSINDLLIGTTIPDSLETTILEKHLIHFPEIVERSIEEWAPHYVVTYLLNIAQAFNSWYGNTKIIDTSNHLVMQYRLAMTKAFHQTMKNGLWLLGIETPEKM
jgi:arginyl-tRNA synthetase